MADAMWVGAEPPLPPPEVPPLPGPEPDMPWTRPPHPPMVPLPGFASAAPGPDVARWLLERRRVVLSGHLSTQLATDTAAQLMLLDADGDDPVEIHLACPDGDLDAAILLADTCDLMGVPVTVVCSGRVGGAALALLGAADRRIAQPHALFVLREPRLEVRGRADEVAEQLAAHRRMMDHVLGRLADVSGRAAEALAADLSSGRVFDAAEALSHGLVDEVAEPARTSGGQGRHSTSGGRGSQRT